MNIGICITMDTADATISPIFPEGVFIQSTNLSIAFSAPHTRPLLTG